MIRLLLFPVSMSILLVACEKEKPVLSECTDCEFNALLDSNSWQASVTSCYYIADPLIGEPYFSISAEENNSNDSFPDVFSIFNIPAKTGTFIVKQFTILTEPSASFSVREYHGDRRDRYEPSVLKESIVQVLHFDEVTGEWSLRFGFHLSLTRAGLPETDNYPRDFSIEGFALGKFGQ